MTEPLDRTVGRLYAWLGADEEQRVVGRAEDKITKLQERERVVGWCETIEAVSHHYGITTIETEIIHRCVRAALQGDEEPADIMQALNLLDILRARIKHHGPLEH